MKNRIISQESAMLPRLQARYSFYDGPMAHRPNWIQRAMRRAKRIIGRKK